MADSKSAFLLRSFIGESGEVAERLNAADIERSEMFSNIERSEM